MALGDILGEALKQDGVRLTPAYKRGVQDCIAVLEKLQLQLQKEEETSGADAGTQIVRVTATTLKSIYEQMIGA